MGRCRDSVQVSILDRQPDFSWTWGKIIQVLNEHVNEGSSENNTLNIEEQKVFEEICHLLEPSTILEETFTTLDIDNE